MNRVTDAQQTTRPTPETSWDWTSQNSSDTHTQSHISNLHSVDDPHHCLNHAIYGYGALLRSSRATRHPNPGTPGCYRAYIAFRRARGTNLAPQRNHVHVQRVAKLRGDFGLQAVHVARRAMPVFLCRPDPAQPPSDAPAMRVHRENLTV